MKIYSRSFYSLFLMSAMSFMGVCQAQVIPEMADFLKKVNSNPAKAISESFSFNAYIKDIEISTGNDGKKFAILELANDKLNGVVISWGGTPMYCVVPIDVASKFDKSQKVNISGNVHEIKKIQNKNHVIAACEVDTPKVGEIKSTRTSDPLVNSNLTTAKLCDSNEKVIFECNTGKKTVAVCSSENGVKYRYGVSKDKLDITVNGKDAKVGSYMLSGGSVWYYRFSNGSTRYVVYTAESTSIDKAGVVVENESKRLANLSCKNLATVNESLAGEPNDEEGFDLP